MSARLAADRKTAYGRFVDRVVRDGQAWALVDGERRGVYVDSLDRFSDDGEPAAVHLLFSARAYAARLAVAEWADRRPLAIPLSELLDRMLPSLADAEQLVGLDYPPDLAGSESDPAELRTELLDSMSAST